MSNKTEETISTQLLEAASAIVRHPRSLEKLPPHLVQLIVQNPTRAAFEIADLYAKHTNFVVRARVDGIAHSSLPPGWGKIAQHFESGSWSILSKKGDQLYLGIEDVEVQLFRLRAQEQGDLVLVDEIFKGLDSGYFLNANFLNFFTSRPSFIPASWKISGKNIYFLNTKCINEKGVKGFRGMTWSGKRWEILFHPQDESFGVFDYFPVIMS